MEIHFKEITLKRISKEDIEMLRNWRNQKNVVENMFFQEEISKGMQKKWFNSLNEETDFYFEIIFQNKPIGLINMKAIDWNTKTGEAGLFIAVEKFRNTPLAIYSSLALLKYFFEKKQLEKIVAKVKAENTNIIVYNKYLGFEFINDLYVLTKEKYYNYTKYIIKEE